MSAKKDLKLFDSLLQSGDSDVFRIWMKFKIFNRIVASIAVFMVHRFPGFQRAMQMLGHYQAMFVDFASFVCHRMMHTQKNFNISMACRMSLQRFVAMFFGPTSHTNASITHSSETFFLYPSRQLILSGPTNRATFCTDELTLKTESPCKVSMMSQHFFIKPRDVVGQVLSSHEDIMPYRCEQVNKLFSGG